MRGGYARRTADGVIGISGQPVRIYGLQVTSGATAGRVKLYDGTDATGTLLLDADGEPSKTAAVPDMPSGGIYFPAGCFADIDANVTAVVADYEQVIAR